jgi:hypothetical protein
MGAFDAATLLRVKDASGTVSGWRQSELETKGPDTLHADSMATPAVG